MNEALMISVILHKHNACFLRNGYFSSVILQRKYRLFMKRYSKLVIPAQHPEISAFETNKKSALKTGF
jgi:hypothetical protein